MKETESLKLARTFLGKTVEVVFDRPVGTKHPKYDFIYEQNYGNIPGVLSPDGEDLDAFYLGETKPLKKAKGTCIAIIHRRDDDDDKLVVVPKGFSPTDAEIMKLVHFQEQFFDSIVIRTERLRGFIDKVAFFRYSTHMKSSALTPQLKTAVRHEVFAAVRDLFADPDFGLELSARAKQRLRLARKGGGKKFSLAEMRRRYA